MAVPIGQSDFRRVIDRKFDFVDKTLLIKAVLDESADVLVFPRPRRFGKTLNLSMLRYFFSEKVDGILTSPLFDGLNITRAGDAYMRHQGKYPVIFLTLKSVKDGSFASAYAALRYIVAELYGTHRYLLMSLALDDEEKVIYQAILRREADEEALQFSLKRLTEYLCRHTGIAPIVLIDEYDTPIQSGYLSGYYEEIIRFMRIFMGEALKDNRAVSKAVLTGILRVSKESLFSGLNNPKVYSLLNSKFGEFFGFTEDEVTALIAKSALTHNPGEIKQWYNGYRCGDVLIYNPWSITNCIDQQGELKPYWINTSGNELIKHLLQIANSNIKQAFEELLQGRPVEQIIDENLVFGDLATNETALWSLFLFSGYLKAIHTEQQDRAVKCALLFPNKEVEALYRSSVQEWFTDRIGDDTYNQFLGRLINGQLDDFTQQLRQFLLEFASYFDTSGHMPEKFYHGFVLGLIANLSRSHIIKSNHEYRGACPGMFLAGGRYDVMIIPRDIQQYGIVLEFKTVFDEEADLKAAAREALDQIINRQYAIELRQIGIQRIIHMGLAFRKKEVQTAYE